MTTLVLAAHPDDEVLGCAGTIARLARAGEAVHICILGEGATARYDTRGSAGTAEVDALAATSREVAELLGAKEVRLLGLPDNRLDTVPLLEVVQHVEAVIDELQPEVVYTQHGGDLNIDHVTLYRATLTATRPVPGHPVRAVYAYEVASSTEWSFARFEPAFRPTTFVEIGATLEVKLRAMEMYEAEVRPFPHPRSPEALRARAHHWGSAVGVEAAEAFELVRELR